MYGGKHRDLLRKWRQPPATKPRSGDMCEGSSRGQDQQPRSELLHERVIIGEARCLTPEDTVADADVPDLSDLAPDELLVVVHPARMR